MCGAGLSVNTTSLGMDGEGGTADCSLALLPDAVVTDIVYVPLKTPFLTQAVQQGFAVVDGLGMLLHRRYLVSRSGSGVARWSTKAAALIIEDMDKH